MKKVFSFSLGVIFFAIIVMGSKFLGIIDLPDGVVRVAGIIMMIGLFAAVYSGIRSYLSSRQ